MATTRLPNWDINSFLPGERKDFSLSETDLLIINPINSLYRNTVHRTNILINVKERADSLMVSDPGATPGTGSTNS